MAELKCNGKNRYNNHLNLIDPLHKTDFDSKIICFRGVNYFLLGLSSKSSGWKCSAIFRYLSIRHV